MTAIERCVIVGGNGQMGRMFSALLAGPGTEVVCVDPQPPAAGTPAARWLPGDVRDPDEEVAAAIRRADLLLLAVPEPVAIAALPVVATLLPPGALLADTLSTKTAIAGQVARHVRDREVLSLNPMFAPALGPAGRAVAAVTLADGPRVALLLGLLRDAGATVVELTAAEHDAVTAVSQVATHAAVLAFGLAAASIGVDAGVLRALAPPPHEALLAITARIASGTPEVYWDVQHGNPMASAARQALRDGLDRIAACSSEPEFAGLLAEIGAFLGTRDRTELADRCQELFRLMAGPGQPRVAP